MSLIVVRTCTPVLHERGAEHAPPGAPAPAAESRPLAACRDVSAYVLLGDPGAGKTTALRSECAALGCEHAVSVDARDFLTFDPKARPEWRGKTLFIDGLDEVRAGASDARTPFDAIRERLDALGRPRFRLSCRAADWLGGNDRDRLQSVAPDGRVTVLALDPLTSDDVLRILDDRNVPDAAVFIESAAVRGLDALLANPQSLGMLADAVGSGGAWPESRRETFERACRSMVDETNEEHRVAPDARPFLPVELVDAAGRLCAGLLLADCDGCTLRGPASNARYPVLDHCIEASEGAARSAAGAGRTDTGSAVFRRALATRLFTSPDGKRFTPVHRHVAEFLAARHVARLVEGGLPVRRVLALITGGDAKVVTPLRGFAGWLAALCGCPGVRRELIDRDPVGVALYGDARAFPPDDKRRLLKVLHREAPQLAEFPSASGAGAFVTADLEPALREILSAPRRDPEHQRFAFFVLRAAAAPLPGVSELLLDVVRDDGRYADVRAAALWAFMRTAPDGQEMPAALVVLLDEVRRGDVSDPDDELRDMLLTHLYPGRLPASRVLDYLTDGRGRTSFWHSLPERAPDAAVAVLLDGLVSRRGTPAPAAAGPGREATDPALTGLNTLDLLARGLEAHGDALNTGRLWDWLGVGLVSRSYAEDLALLDDEDEAGDGNGSPVPRVRAWLAARPDRQKAIVAEGLRRWTASGWPAGGPRIDERLYEADPPSDLGCWCLDEALVAADPRAADWLLGRALHAVVTGAGAAGLSDDRLRERTRGHDRLRGQLEDMLASPVDAGRSARRQTWLARDEQRRKPLRQAVQAQAAALRENRCPPGVLRPLAAAWFGLLPEITGDDARTRLRNLLAPDTRLVDAALAGLRGAPARTDVPAAEDVVRRGAEGEEYHLALPVQAGMAVLDAAQPDGPLPLDEHPLRSALAFHYTTPVAAADGWYRRVVRFHPEIVADVLRLHAAAELRRGNADVPALYALAHDEDHRRVAARGALPLLRSFPTRCRNAQVGALTWLLRAALRWADRPELCRLIERKLGARSMNDAQRTPWLAAGLAAAPDRWRAPLESFVQGRDARLRQLAAFFLTDEGHRPSRGMKAPELALLIRLLGPVFGPSRELGFGHLSLALAASIGVGVLLDRLAASPDPAAGDALADLASDSSLSAWRAELVRKRDEQRVVRRDAHYCPPGIEQVCRTLANGPPANAGDLAALLVDRLHEIAVEVRTGNANGWRLFWNEGAHREPSAPRHENSCRDALLHLLRQRLPGVVDAQPEGQYANERRADVRVACGDFQVPIEIKKNTHRDLWSAMRGQLLAHYTQDPATDGYGIYLVFWFGADGTPPPPDGPPPRSAEELERRLTESLSAAEARRTAVRVIDVSRPAPRAGPDAAGTIDVADQRR